MCKRRISIITLAVLFASAIGVAAQDDPSSRPPIPSAGCGTTEIGPGILFDLPVEVDGVEQRFAMQVPDSCDGMTPVPLWLQFHGSGLSMYDALPKVSAGAGEHGFVAVAPQGFFEGPQGQSGWGWRPDDTEFDLTPANPDIAYIDGLIDHLAGTLCIDLARVYAAGFSNGGGAATVAACALDDRIAAAASAAGLVFDLGDACDQQRPVPYLAIHGTTDGTVYFEGGTIIDHPIKDRYVSTPIPDRVAAIALRNGCQPGPSTEVLTDAVEPWAEAVERWTWDCPRGAEVELIVHGGGHAWPQSGNVGFDATELVWEFFEQHPMPE